MKNFLVFIRYKVPIEVVEQHTPEHRSYLRTLYEKGDLLFSGPLVPRTAGVLWAQAAEKSRVEEFTKADPFYKNGVADYEILEFNPVMNAPVLDALFSQQRA